MGHTEVSECPCKVADDINGAHTRNHGHISACVSTLGNDLGNAVEHLGGKAGSIADKCNGKCHDGYYHEHTLNKVSPCNGIEAAKECVYDDNKC